MYRVAGIDSAHSTGWAILERCDVTGRTRLCAYGKESFRPRTGESGAMVFIKFNTWVREFMSQQPKLDLVAFEMPMVRFQNAARITYGLATRIEEAGEQIGIPTTSYVATTIKKHATGKGNCGKPAMIKAATSLFKIQLGKKDDDIADAIHVACMAMETYSGKVVPV